MKRNRNKAHHSTSSRLGHQLGFSFIEIIIVIVLIGGTVAFMLNAVPNGIRVFSQGTESHVLYYLAKEKMAEIQALGIWIQDVDTQNPTFPSRSNDPANLWKTELDLDGRSLSSQVRGQIAVTKLDETYTTFDATDEQSTPRERFEISITMTQDTSGANIKSYLTVTASQESLKGLLLLMRRALVLYAEDNGFYPASNDLAQLVPNYLPYIPNDPYTLTPSPHITGTESSADFEYSNVGGVFSLYAKSHDPIEYPAMEVTW